MPKDEGRTELLQVLLLCCTALLNGHNVASLLLFGGKGGGCQVQRLRGAVCGELSLQLALLACCLVALGIKG